MEKVRVAVVGCGSVSGPYLEDMRRSPCVELVGACDIAPERAQRRAEEFGIPRHFPDVESLLAGAEFDLLVNLTSMQSHYAVNLAGLEAGKHVWSEKPIAGTREEGRHLLETARERGLRFYGAPTVVQSPAFAALAEAVTSGRIGRVHAARGRYGHSGPGWGPWFYRKGGGALFDLGVYNVTTLTGLLGPAQAVVALSGTAIEERVAEGQRVQVEAEDNIMLLLDHGDNVLSSIATGFVYGRHREDRTIDLVGTRGSLGMLGWDWLPSGVELWRDDRDAPEVLCPDQQGYSWERGGSTMAEHLATGRPLRMTAEHAYHVLDVMLAAHESAACGRRIEVTSRFPWPLVAGATSLPGAADAPQSLDPDNHNR